MVALDAYGLTDALPPPAGELHAPCPATLVELLRDPRDTPPTAVRFVRVVRL